MFIFLVVCGKTLVRWPRMCDSLLSAIEAAAAADVFSSSVFLTHQSSIREKKRKERKKRYYGKRRGVFSKGYTHIPIRHIGCYKKDRENGKKKNLFVYACLVFSAVRYDDSRLSSLLSGVEWGKQTVVGGEGFLLLTQLFCGEKKEERGNAPARRRVETARRKICQERKETKKIVCRIHFKPISPFFCVGDHRTAAVFFFCFPAKKWRITLQKKVGVSAGRKEGRRQSSESDPTLMRFWQLRKRKKSGKTEVGDFLDRVWELF